MKEKINELFEIAKVNSVFLKNMDFVQDPNFYYFTGLVGNFSHNFCILRPGKKPIVFSSVLDYDEVKKNKNLLVKKYSKKHFPAALRKELKGKRIGYNAEFYPKNPFRRLKKILKGKKFVDVSRKLFELRSIKLDKELSKIAQSAGIAEKVLNEVPKIFRKGMTEKELAIELEYRAKRLGAEDLSYPTIVASGKNAATPHSVPSGKKISKGFLMIDFGVRYRNYCSDLSRTFFVGRAGGKEKKLYSAVFNAKEAGEALLKQGAKAGDVFKVVDRCLQREVGMKMIHGVGHGLGVEPHDAPDGFFEKSKTRLKKNMVFTVEPAIYGKFGGIRIEDDIVIGKNSCRKLSNAPKKLIELG